MLLAVGCSKNDDDFIGEELETPTKLAIQITETDAVLRFSDNETKTIHYTIVGDGANLVVKAEMQNDDEGYTLRTTPTSKTTGTVEIRAKNPTDNRVTISVSDGRQTVQTSIAVSGYPLSNSKTLQVETPGTLSQLLSGYDYVTITELTVTGSINDKDIATLNALNLSVLDLENANLTELPWHSFAGRNKLTSIKLPRTLTTIGEGAFFYCTGLTNITIPGSVNTIGYMAFVGCSELTNVTIQEGVTTIDSLAFWGCKGLTSITIPGSVTTIGREAFSGCRGLTSLTIQEGVKTIGEYAFSGCTGLTSVTIPGSVTTIEKYAFSSGSGLTNVTIQEGVTTIGDAAFLGCKGLTGTLTIPGSVTTIEKYAFSGCYGLTSMTIPGSVKTIGYQAFFGCTGLTQIECKSNTPPELEPSVFSYVPTSSCVLHIPTGCAQAYRTAEGWKDFKKIVETEF